MTSATSSWTDNDFGNFKLVTKSGYKYEDMTGDNKTVDDMPIEGWTIYLKDATGTNTFSTTTTNENGYYEFTGIGPGTYTVYEELPDGWIQMYPGAGFYNFTTESGVNHTGNDFYNFLPKYFLKQFSDSGNLTGFTKPTISEDGLSSEVFELHSGPRIWWEITYYFENSWEYLGEDYDGQAHNFTLWDKWGGNLMAMPYEPTEFDSSKNEVTLSDGTIFTVDVKGYKAYVGDGINVTDNTNHGEAWITLHMGDQQNTTNPGKGKGSKNKDGKSYDVDVVWYMGELGDGESAILTIYVAPGMNPSGKLQFSSPGYNVINTGPRVRAYAAYDDFLYAISRTIQLDVYINPK